MVCEGFCCIFIEFALVTADNRLTSHLPEGSTMLSSARDFLIKLLETPGPSGYEQPVQAVIQD